MGLNKHAMGMADDAFYEKYDSLEGIGIQKTTKDGEKNENYETEREYWWKQYKIALEKVAKKTKSDVHSGIITGTLCKVKFVVPAPRFVSGGWLGATNKLKNASIGETVTMHIITEGMAEIDNCSITVKEHDPKWDGWDRQIGKITDVPIIHNEIFAPINFKKEWFEKKEDDSGKLLRFVIEGNYKGKPLKAEFPEKTNDYLLVSAELGEEFKLLVATIFGEAGLSTISSNSRKAIAWVIKNRVNGKWWRKKKNITDVITQKQQFDAYWMTYSGKQGTKQFQIAKQYLDTGRGGTGQDQKIIDGIITDLKPVYLEEENNFVNGANHYYSPVTQKKVYGKIPTWVNSSLLKEVFVPGIGTDDFKFLKIK